jgi:hypothetical protein
MTVHRRVIEDRAYGAADDLAELAGIKADLMLAVGRMDRLIKRLDGDLCGNVEDAANMVQDDVVNGRLFLAEQAIKGTLPDTSAADRRAQIPGSY